MKAIVYNHYGPPEVLRLQDFRKPVPSSNEIIVKVVAVSVNYGDLIARNFRNITPKEFNMPLFFWLPARIAFGLHKPKRTILGNEFSGVVESVGAGVTRFNIGDCVFGYTGEKMGTYAEYVCVSEDGFVTTKPENVSFEEASCISYGALMGINVLRKINSVKAGRALVIGASGAIGSAVVQLLKQTGARVDGVCGQTGLEYLQTLGVDEVFDYTNNNYLAGPKYDLIVDVLGKNSFSRVKSSLTFSGVYLPLSFKAKKLMQMIWTALFEKKRIICALAVPKPKDMDTLKNMIAAGKIKAVVDKVFSFDKASDAHFYAENSHRKGSVVILLNQCFKV